MTDLIESEFPQPDNLIYLNHAGVSPWPARSARAVAAFAQENATLGAANYPQWIECERRLRQQLQALINAPDADDIALIKNTSEGLSFIAAGLDWRPGDNVVSSDEEFPSNRLAWEVLGSRGVELRRVPLSSGASPEDALTGACDARTRLLAISSVQYATGLRLDLDALGTHCTSKDILFCVDAIQSLGAVPFDVERCRADFVVADGHKWMMGPEGIGLFYVNPALRDRLKLTEFGWHMVANAGDYEQLSWQPAGTAQRFECGSPNMVGAIGLSASLSLLAELGIDHVAEILSRKMQYLVDCIASIRPQLDFISDVKAARRAGIVTIRPRIQPVSQIYQYLRANDVICATRAGGIRLSPHFYTPEWKLDRYVELLRSALSSTGS